MNRLPVNQTRPGQTEKHMAAKRKSCICERRASWQQCDVHDAIIARWGHVCNTVMAMQVIMHCGGYDETVAMQCMSCSRESVTIAQQLACNPDFLQRNSCNAMHAVTVSVWGSVRTLLLVGFMFASKLNFLTLDVVGPFNLNWM